MPQNTLCIECLQPTAAPGDFLASPPWSRTAAGAKRSLHRLVQSLVHRRCGRNNRFGQDFAKTGAGRAGTGLAQSVHRVFRGLSQRLWMRAGNAVGGRHAVSYGARAKGGAAWRRSCSSSQRLSVEAAAEAGKLAVGADDAMAGTTMGRDWPVGGATARGRRAAEALCQLAVADGAGVGQPLQFRPTARWKGVPRGARAISKTVSSPANQAASCSRGCAGRRHRRQPAPMHPAWRASSKAMQRRPAASHASNRRPIGVAKVNRPWRSSPASPALAWRPAALGRGGAAPQQQHGVGAPGRQAWLACSNAVAVSVVPGCRALRSTMSLAGKASGCPSARRAR